MAVPQSGDAGQVASVSLSLQVGGSSAAVSAVSLAGSLGTAWSSRGAGGVQWLRGADWQDGMRKRSLPYSGPTSEDLS